MPWLKVSKEVEGIFGTHDATFTAAGVSLIRTKEKNDLYTVTISAQQSLKTEITALGQVHLPQDIDVTENGRWAMV